MVLRSLVALMLLAVCGRVSALGLETEDGRVKDVVARIGNTPGVGVVLGDDRCRLAIALAKRSRMIWYVQLPDADAVEAASRAADAEGMYGTRVFVAQGSPARIGLADNLADVVLAADDPAGVGRIGNPSSDEARLPDGLAIRPTVAPDRAEILRVLRPEGRAIVGRQEWVKPAPPGVDDWSHHYHRPDNNPLSHDSLARAPYLTQFVVEPRYGPAPQAAVASGGRLFMAFGHVAWHQREEPWLNTLVALNAFNGAMLWTRPLTPGIMVDRSTMIATPQTLYLADDQSCKLLDPASGKVLDQIVPPVELTGGTFWKWMALEGGVLYALVGPSDPLDQTARWKSTNHGWPWEGISQGYNNNEYRWGYARTLLAIDPKSKKVLWKHQEDPPIDSRSLAMKSGRIYFASFGRYLACVEAASGQLVWKRTAQQDPELFRSIGPYRPGHGYVGGWKSTVYLKCTDRALYFVGPQVEWLTAVSTSDGRVLWKHPAKDLQIVIRDDGLYAVGAQNSRDDTKKLDPLTGEVLAIFAATRRACTRSTGCADSIFFRASEGSGRLDTERGAMQWISSMRPSCQVGVIIAQGHLYWLPWTCDCDLQLFGSICLGPAGHFDFDAPAKDDQRLQTRSAGPGDATALAVRPADWPTYRADNARTAQSGALIPAKPKLLWSFLPLSLREREGVRGPGEKVSDRATPPTAGHVPLLVVNPSSNEADLLDGLPIRPTGKPACELTAPVAAGDRVFFGGGDGIVRALEAATGKPRWTAYTGGAVRFPPTIARGLALVGSGDGWVYAFDAASGRTVWRFRAAPIERRIAVYGSLLSTWPASSGVLVDGDQAYFAAGMTDLDGTHVYAVDLASGRLRWQNNQAGHLDAASSRGIACQGELLLTGGRLYLAGGNAVSPGVFDAADGRCLSQPPGGHGTSAPRGRELTLVSNHVAVSGQPLYSLAEYPVYDASCQWREAAVTARNARLACIPRKEQGRTTWTLTARNLAGGDILWSQPLAAEPVRWAIAVDASGRIYVTLRSGEVDCFGS
jgi:outer membrane protein assembly factor BamB